MKTPDKTLQLDPIFFAAGCIIAGLMINFGTGNLVSEISANFSDRVRSFAFLCTIPVVSFIAILGFDRAYNYFYRGVDKPCNYTDREEKET